MLVPDIKLHALFVVSQQKECPESWFVQKRKNRWDWASLGVEPTQRSEQVGLSLLGGLAMSAWPHGLIGGVQVFNYVFS
jgi:hypothetical protein